MLDFLAAIRDTFRLSGWPAADTGKAGDNAGHLTTLTKRGLPDPGFRRPDLSARARADRPPGLPRSLRVSVPPRARGTGGCQPPTTAALSAVVDITVLDVVSPTGNDARLFGAGQSYPFAPPV